MKLAILASLFAGATAFAPAQNSAPRVQVSLQAKSSLSGEIGALPPLGFFDPLNTANDDKELFDSLREVELKHGRVAMLAFVGYTMTASGTRIPGYEDVPGGLKALSEMPASGYAYVFVTCAICEILCHDATGKAEFAGDYRNGFDFGWDTQTDEWKRNKRTIEINNGRAAMMAILALMTHDALGNINSLPGCGTWV